MKVAYFSFWIASIIFLSRIRVCMSSQSRRKIRILVEGWLYVPHSYAIVNGFQIIHLLKHYSDDIILYFDQISYYNVNWKDNNLYPLEYHDLLLHSLEPWQGETVDIIYRISYPNDLYIDFKSKIPTIVFYSSVASLFLEDFVIGPYGAVNSTMLAYYLCLANMLSLVTPTPWSARGMGKYIGPCDVDNSISLNDKLAVITHGVDMNIFENDFEGEKRRAWRQTMGASDDDIVFLNIGAMTDNKGVHLLLLTMYELVYTHGIHNIKLVLKGVGSIYPSMDLLNGHINFIIQQGLMIDDLAVAMVRSNVIFVDQTLTFVEMNDLYNAADAYISPYIVEGFNLPVLEAVAVGLPVFVTATGCTAWYIDDIISRVPGATNRIFRLPVEFEVFEWDRSRNVANLKVSTIVNSILTNLPFVQADKQLPYYQAMREVIEQSYSWSAVAHQLMDRFRGIISLFRSPEDESLL